MTDEEDPPKPDSAETSPSRNGAWMTPESVRQQLLLSKFVETQK